MFFDDTFSEPLTQNGPALLAESSAPELHWPSLHLEIDENLAQSWQFLRAFSAMINSAAEHKRQLPKETLLNAMGSSMYRLIHMRFDPHSTDEAIRLGLLVFSFHIFLNWQGMKLPHGYLPSTYQTCLLNLKPLSELPPQVVLWLLLIGSLAVFTAADDGWLTPWMRDTIDLCGRHDWDVLRGQLKDFPWIDILHDDSAQARFDVAISLRTDGEIMR